MAPLVVHSAGTLNLVVFVVEEVFTPSLPSGGVGTDSKDRYARLTMPYEVKLL